MKKLILLLILLRVGTLAGIAQFQTGIRTSNYAGVMGIGINPSFTNYLNNGTDIQLFGVSTSVLNNGFYLDPKPVTSVVTSDIFTAFDKKTNNTGESMSQTFERVFKIRRDLQPNNYIFVDLTVNGPSFLTNIGKHSFGITTALKGSTGTINMAPLMATFLQKGILSTDLFGKNTALNGVNSGTILYQDIGVNYSYQIRNTYASQQRLGISVHYLRGINSMVFQDLGNSKWSFPGDSVLVMTDANFRYNYAATKSADFAELFAHRGNGVAVDLGYTYMRKKKNHATRITVCPNIRYGGKTRQFQDYKWKLGIALMDVGFINFNHQTVSTQYSNSWGPTKNLDLAFYSGLFALDRQLRYDFALNPGAKLEVDDHYTHYTASRVNLQFDYNYQENIYFNFALSHRVPMPNTIAMLAPNIMSLTARYEKMRYEIGVPVSIIEYQYPIVGFNFRYGPFYMGTNHLFEMIGLRRTKGLDLFMGLKFNLSLFRGV